MIFHSASVHFRTPCESVVNLRGAIKTLRVRRNLLFSFPPGCSSLIIIGFLVHFRRHNILKDFAISDLIFRPIPINRLNVQIHDRFLPI